ncbi:F0F1 ATP synthase subunit epsilon [Spiroplasma clarkii]|uniref:F0F1 ATP synthase subunit epsilon n=1 Tax=Spiroplasma clarkii TaxID=2139 RepID=UPI0021503909|nr:F0F1 ATP synthase subunit epsilon [Spiroplasma clarkii]
MYLDKEVEYVNTQTVAGDMTIYSRHASIVSTLKIGVVKYATDKGIQYVHVHRGLLRVNQNQVLILSQWLYLVDEKGKKTGENFKNSVSNQLHWLL